MEQSDALDCLHSGRNTYITGAAGTGKTHVLNSFLADARKQGRRIAPTASTGIAATHIEGRTLHSLVGLGVADSYSEKMIAKIARKPWVSRTIERLDGIVIDEVSMLTPLVFDAADRVCQQVRGSTAPFGGLQVVLCGDFFQLPPVIRSSPTNASTFIYDSPTWKTLGLSVAYLHRQYRHADDPLHVLLNNMRDGAVSSDDVEALNERRNADLSDSPALTRLHTHNTNVDRINEHHLGQLPDKEHVYVMTTTGEEALVSSLQKGCLAPKQLRLRAGAVVMFVKNGFDDGYMNGTLGIVTGFADDDAPIVETNTGTTIQATRQTWDLRDPNDKSLASLCQIPLRLAWAITVHKSQGMSLTAVEMDLSKTFVSSMGYVALSRATALSGISLLGLNSRALRISERAIEIDLALRSVDGVRHT